MDIDRRSGAPSAFTWLLGMALGATCAAMTPACSASSANPPSGWAQSGGGPLGADTSSGGGGSGDDATTGATTPVGGGDAAPVPASDAGASDDGATGSEDGGDATDAANDAPAETGGDAAGDGGAMANFTLLDTTVTNVVDGSPVPGFDPIPGGATINLGKVGSALSVRANTVPAAVGSVAFALDATYTHTENTAPYTLCSDNGAGVVTSCASILTVGAHTLKATPYSAADLGGTAGTPFTVAFTIVDTDAGAADAAAKDATDQ
ncbi:MAG: hypothetical protein ABSE49_05635 [Polyangiaceae bacterium]|jgi:hypothetical protein